MKPLSDITNTLQRHPYNTIYNNIIQLQVPECILYRNLVVLIPLQNMFKIFPQISGLENIAFIKGQYRDLAITIETAIFNFNKYTVVLQLLRASCSS